MLLKTLDRKQYFRETISGVFFPDLASQRGGSRSWVLPNRTKKLGESTFPGAPRAASAWGKALLLGIFCWSPGIVAVVVFRCLGISAGILAAAMLLNEFFKVKYS